MNRIRKALALSCLGLLITPLVHAQTIADLSCTPATEANINTPVYAFLLDVNEQTTPGVFDVTFYMPLSLLTQLFRAQSTQTPFNCTLASGSESLEFANAVVKDVMAAGAGAGVQGASAQVYASATFFFKSVQFEGASVSTNGKSTPEAEAKALAAIRARGLAIPKGVGAQ